METCTQVCYRHNHDCRGHGAHVLTMLWRLHVPTPVSKDSMAARTHLVGLTTTLPHSADDDVPPAYKSPLRANLQGRGRLGTLAENKRTAQVVWRVLISLRASLPLKQVVRHSLIGTKQISPTCRNTPRQLCVAKGDLNPAPRTRLSQTARQMQVASPVMGWCLRQGAVWASP